MGEHSATQEPQRGEIGWPAPPRKGKGLGWPGDLPTSGPGSAA
jgi:hypothetical protein